VAVRISKKHCEEALSDPFPDDGDILGRLAFSMRFGPVLSLTIRPVIDIMNG